MARTAPDRRRSPDPRQDRRSEPLTVEETPVPLPLPPSSWREHWHEHRQLLTLFSADDDCAIYLDPDVRRSEAGWLRGYVGDVWRYSKAAYGGAFGPDPRLYSIHHAGRYGGGHPGSHTDPSHDHRNVSDCGLDSWDRRSSEGIALMTHEIAHCVESGNNGMKGSPAFSVWGDSKWAEFFVHDVFRALGRRLDAQRVHREFSAGQDDFPRPGTHWFRDWFFPLWQDCGGTKVMNEFFALTSSVFPSSPDGAYHRDMDLGEYIHFTSGAAGADLRPLAVRAFGPSRSWGPQLEAAAERFPQIRY